MLVYFLRAVETAMRITNSAVHAAGAIAAVGAGAAGDARVALSNGRSKRSVSSKLRKQERRMTTNAN